MDIQFQDEIKVGKFVDIEKPEYLQKYNEYMSGKFKDKFKPYGVQNEEK